MSADPLFHMVVEDVFSIAGRGTVVTGKIDTGTLNVGDEIVIRSGAQEKKVIVAGIEALRKVQQQAQEGDTVGVLLKDVKRSDVQRGAELAAPGLDFTWKP